MVSRDVVCRLVKLAGSGVLEQNTISLALLMKWVSRITGPKEDLVMKVLKDCDGMWLDGERQMAPIQGASMYWHGLRHVQEFSRPN